MKIMVFDVPAESGGALSVLYDFYNDYRIDINNEYIFVVSKPELQETDNIKVLRFPWIKKGWFHRLYFDHCIAPKLIRQLKPDEILSLQNIMIPHTKVMQSVYVHNALPLAEYRFSFFENKLLWVYQNFIGRSIFRSIKKANKVFVQTNWMKKKFIEKLNIDSKKIQIIPPKVEIVVKKSYCNTQERFIKFFYPANGEIFKNHKVIVEACLILHKQCVNGYRVIFTLKGNENKNVMELYKNVIKNNLPIDFVGNLLREEVFDYYSQSILIYPSFIETVGLPLIEAKTYAIHILASDCEYSHEVLDDYDKVEYFNYNNALELSDFMMKYL